MNVRWWSADRILDYSPYTALLTGSERSTDALAQVKTALEQSAGFVPSIVPTSQMHRTSRLFGGIVGEAKQLIEKTYPGAQFHFLGLR
jgi:hypothetical protein